MNKFLCLMLLMLTGNIQAELQRDDTHLNNSQLRPVPEAQSSMIQVQQVESLHRGLIETMQASLAFDERSTKLEPYVESTFDITTISRLALGSHWRTLSADDQMQIEKLMKELILTSYASRFINYKKEAFDTESDQPVGKDRHMVRTTLTTASGEVVTLDYHLTNRSGQWKIYDVIAKGVSDLSLKRSVYGASFQKDGLAGVTSDIKQNIEKNRSQ